MTTRVTTASGDLEGRERRGVRLFASVPYASAPVGDRRFAPPAPHPGWDGVREATRFGPAAPQLPTGGLTSAAAVRWDEDCLTLNVSTPAVDDARRPVLVWIHGGAYVNGQGAIPWYSGESFATNGDIVTVSINYRLGALGFANLDRFGPDFADSGTLGLQDMVAALEWVRDNIEAFGGDPAQVTIAGESAGAFAVSSLLTMASAQGLFHRAIAQSGAGHHTMTADQSAATADLLFTELGATTIEDLRAAPAAQILEAQTTVTAKVTSAGELRDRLRLTTGPFYPAHGGAVLPAAPIDAARSGAGHAVALLTGTNLHETSLFGSGQMSEERVRRLAAEYSSQPNSLIDAYKEEGLEHAADIGLAMSTDWSFRIPALRHAEHRAAAGADTWMYVFTWESRHETLRSTHALEIPFTFNTLDAPGVDVFIGPGDVPRSLAATMHGCWTSFIRSGDPATDVVPDWPTYDTEERAVLEFGDDVGLRHDPSPATRRAWDGQR